MAKRYSGFPRELYADFFSRPTVRIVAAEGRNHAALWWDEIFDEVDRMPIPRELIEEFRAWNQGVAELRDDPWPRYDSWNSRFSAQYMVGRRLAVRLAQECADSHDVWMLIAGDPAHQNGWAFIAPDADPESL